MKSYKTNCIMCPLGCELSVKLDGDKILSVAGNGCHRGIKYIETEHTSPVRNISTLIKVGEGVVPVKSSLPVPKGKIDDILREISKINLKEMPKFGTIVIKNILNLNVDIVTIGF